MSASDPMYAERLLSLLGRERAGLPTPVLQIDPIIARRNIALLAERSAGGARLRPHGKSHKCAELAQWQLAAGAIGLTTATAWEAVAFAHRGITDLLVANVVVGTDKLNHLATAAHRTSITVAVDDADNVRELGLAAQRAGSELGVLIDVDVGMARAGVRNVAAAEALAEVIGRQPGVRLRGVMGYEGQCALEPDVDLRRQLAARAMERLLEVKERLARCGHAVEVVSAGGTATMEITGRIPGITEIQAGSYVLMDNARRAIAPDFAPALSVLATVVSRHGPTLVLDAGRKTIGLELAAPSIAGVAATLRKSSDEHLIFELADPSPLRVGDRVDVIPGYLPTTIALHSAYLVMEGGCVSDLWPVLARGAGQPWVP